MTVSFEDALLSPIGFSILSGAGLFKGRYSNSTNGMVHYHVSSVATMDATGKIDLTDAVAELADMNDRFPSICVDDAPIYVMGVEADGSITGEVIADNSTKNNINILDGTQDGFDGTSKAKTVIEITDINASANVMVDFYVDLPGEDVYEADITQDTFAGYYYVEADTLYREQETGKDLPANLTYPNVKLQSNFTITMASSGDPSEHLRLAA